MDWELLSSSWRISSGDQFGFAASGISRISSTLARRPPLAISACRLNTSTRW
ncbi:Uncharacterised protein [Mycobacteroides abscessus subsp. abscessus]|nr:Uncharacterised protein [Mycobacteroides abscessus subsp. abscessus]